MHNKEKKSLIQKIKDNKEYAIATAISPIVILPVVYAGIYFYKKYKNK